MRAPDYVWATNAAYSVLLSLPFSVKTDVAGIVDALDNCILMTYARAVAMTGISKDVLMESSAHGFVGFKNGKRIIFVNENAPLGVIRFTCAHEIGHIVLGHTVEDETAEREANCFARNLLCPVPVAETLSLNHPILYEDVFQVTRRAAVVAFERRKADRENISPKNMARMFGKVIQYMETPVFAGK